MTSNVLNFAPNQASSSQNSNLDNTLEGYKIKSTLPYQIFSTLWKNVSMYWAPSLGFLYMKDLPLFRYIELPFHNAAFWPSPNIFAGLGQCIDWVETGASSQKMAAKNPLVY